MAMAKAHYTPTNPLVRETLDRQVEAMAGTFNAQSADTARPFTTSSSFCVQLINSPHPTHVSGLRRLALASTLG
jgi:hypothetical protein